MKTRINKVLVRHQVQPQLRILFGERAQDQLPIGKITQRHRQKNERVARVFNFILNACLIHNVVPSPLID